MLTPPGITNWNTGWFDKKLALLDKLNVPGASVLVGVVGNPQNAIQGLADMKAAALANPPTGNEPNAALYAERYNDQLIKAIQYIEDWASGGAGGGEYQP